MDDYLDTVERQLAQLTASGAHRRARVRIAALLADRARPPAIVRQAGGPGSRRPSDGLGGPRRRPPFGALALGAAVAVTVAVVALALSLRPAGNRSSASSRPLQHIVHHPAPSHHRHNAPAQPPATTTPTPTPVGGPVPPGFGAESFTAISDFGWWLLGNAPCTSPPCTSIVRTTDGGRSFVGVPAPRTTGVSSLRFADASDGYAFGPELWETTDAGASWHQVNIGGTVTDLAIGDGYAYAVVRNGASGRLLRAPIGSDAWTALTLVGNAFSGLWVHGNEVMLQTTNFSNTIQHLMVSSNDGKSFAMVSPPPNVTCSFEGALPVIWAHCATGMLSGVWRSTDSGATFHAATKLPEQPNSAAFGAASNAVAIVGYKQLYRTADGGASWAPVGPAGITWWQYIGFTDPTHGVALGYVGSSPTPANERLYYTIDGGLTYHLVPIS